LKKAASRLSHPSSPAKLPIDAAVVPALLLLIARDLLLYDPPRVLGWRLLHDPRLAPPWLAALLPRPPAGLDQDPVALLLAGLAGTLALAYLAAGLLGARPAVRAGLLGLAASSLVVLPTAALVAMGAATDRPYGQDGGVVQLPLALDRVLSGQSPYGADYSGTILGRQARVSEFWKPYGGNPILHHHAYLPGTHLVMLPFYAAARRALGWFDPRLVTLIAYLAVALLGGLLVGREPDRRLASAGAVALSPLVYWHQVFGANDLIFVAFVLLAAALAERRKPDLAAAVLGLACATKQLAWPFAPFLLVHLAGARSFRELWGGPGLRRLARGGIVAAAVFVAVVAPVAALDFRAFWGDIVVYNVGLPGADNYPLGGTPGFGVANFLIYFGRVSSLADTVPFSRFYVVLAPLGLLLVRWQMREGTAAAALAAGSAALLASVYLSRVVHPNYVVAAAVVLPVALLMARRWPPDVAVVPLLLLGLGAEIAEHQLFRTTWEDAVAVNLPRHLAGVAAALAPRAGPELTRDPLGLAFSALAAGSGILYLLAALLGAPRRARVALTAAAACVAVAAPAWVVTRVGEAAGRPRLQDGWSLQVYQDARRIEDRVPPGRLPSAGGTLGGREARSGSFRSDPPGPIAASPRPGPPGGAALGWFLGRLGVWDPRPVSILALWVAGALLWGALRPDLRPLGIGVILVAPVLAVGAVFGSPEAILLAASVGAWRLARAGRGVGAGAVGGAVGSLAHRVLFLLPFLLLGRGRARSRAGLACVAGAVAGYAAASVPLLVTAPGAFFGSHQPPAAVEPGVGLGNLLLYRGLSGAGAVLAVLAVLAGLAAWAASSVPGRLRGWTGGAVFLLLGAVVSPAWSPHDLALPVVSIVIAAMVAEGGRGGIVGD
jgi:Glycosyltransferase family 87